jgi:hypothetical protein
MYFTLIIHLKSELPHFFGDVLGGRSIRKIANSNYIYHMNYINMYVCFQSPGPEV